MAQKQSKNTIDTELYSSLFTFKITYHFKKTSTLHQIFQNPFV